MRVGKPIALCHLLAQRTLRHLRIYVRLTAPPGRNGKAAVGVTLCQQGSIACSWAKVEGAYPAIGLGLHQLAVTGAPASTQQLIVKLREGA